jgi:hypothetical protein
MADKALATNAQPHSFSTLCISYAVLLIVMLVGVKFAYYPKNNVVEIILDLFILLQATIRQYSKAGGYEPTTHVEAEEVDDSNSITVGYHEDHGKKLFWERNSVEGI